MAIQPVEQGSAFAFRNVINNNFYELKVLSGASKPTQSTAAVVGQMYLDTSEGKMYFCSNVSGSIYTWKPFASDMSAFNVSYNNGSSGMSSDNVQDAIDELFTSASNGKELIADAIAGKGVPTSANDTYATMAGNIEKIETGIDISDATLTSASELKKDIIAYTKTGKRVVGNLGSGTVNNPSISVSTAGKITASTSYTSGIIGSSTISNTYQLSTQSGTTITPGTSKITAVATGKYTTGPVYVAGDSDLVPSNIKSGVSIFGVSGNFSGEVLYRHVKTFGGYSITIPNVPSKPRKIMIMDDATEDFEGGTDVILNLYQTDSGVADNWGEDQWYLTFCDSEGKLRTSWTQNSEWSLTGGNLIVEPDHSWGAGEYPFSSNGYYHVFLIMSE